MTDAWRSVFLDRDSVDRGDLDFSAFDKVLPKMTSFGDTQPSQTIEHIGDAEVVVTNKVVIDEAVLDACTDIKLVIIAATGTNNVDLNGAARRGIAVCNARDYATTSVAQHVFALLLALGRNIESYANAVRDGRWNDSPFFCLLDDPIIDLQDRTLGIVGYGNLGRAVARIGEAFGMKILISARAGSEPTRDRLGMDEFLAASDVVTLHCPLVAETANLIDAAALSKMKPGAILINTARGGLVDEAALADALIEGRIAGAGLDVLRVEPPDGSSPLMQRSPPNLLVTPHNAWASRRSRQRLVDQMVELVESWQNGHAMHRVA